MNTSYLLPYILENTTLYTPTLIGVIIGCILGIVGIIAAYYILLYGNVLIILQDEKRAIEKKKHVLGELILMKDIQTELEAEIEKGMLKSSFQ